MNRLYRTIRTKDWLRPLFMYFEACSGPVIGAYVLLMFVVIITLDYLTGTEIQFFIFYALPVSFSTWFLSKRTGMQIALLSTGIWWTINASGLTRDPYLFKISLWNTFIRLLFFILMVVVVGEGRQLQQELLRLATQDLLTGLRNRRAFLEQFEIEHARAQREHYALTVMYIDLDNFKQVNDQGGHAAGDEVLVQIANILKNSVRTTDITGRLGGDEFALILPNMPLARADEVAHLLQERIHTAMKNDSYPVTASIGVAHFEQLGASPKEMLEQADQLMYQVKQSGKNQVAQALF